MSLPYRASLPYPIPDNMIPFPGALDRLLLNLGHGGVAVSVQSEATGATGTFEEAAVEGRLNLGKPDDRFDIPVTRQERAALSALAFLVGRWRHAFETDDREAMMTVLLALRSTTTPWWLEVRLEMPPRPKAALFA